MKNKLSHGARFYVFLIFAFLYLPIIVMALFSFNDSTSTYIFTGFSTKWWHEMFANEAAMRALRNTLVLAVATAVCSTARGTLAAVGIFNTRNKLYKKSIMAVTNIPMMNPEIVTGISMMLLFAFAGMLVHKSNVLGFGPLLNAHETFSLTYVILNILPKLKQFDMHIYEAAVDLG
ncbi:MAG: ABC transporter permease, partial [Eubacterium sp.]|nr:ABC transporter permease [Eubacterium sp.]